MSLLQRAVSPGLFFLLKVDVVVVQQKRKKTKIKWIKSAFLRYMATEIHETDVSNHSHFIIWMNWRFNLYLFDHLKHFKSGFSFFFFLFFLFPRAAYYIKLSILLYVLHTTFIRSESTLTCFHANHGGASCMATGFPPQQTNLPTSPSSFLNWRGHAHQTMVAPRRRDRGRERIGRKEGWQMKEE